MARRNEGLIARIHQPKKPKCSVIMMAPPAKTQRFFPAIVGGGVASLVTILVVFVSMIMVNPDLYISNNAVANQYTYKTAVNNTGFADFPMAVNCTATIVRLAHGDSYVYIHGTTGYGYSGGTAVSVEKESQHATSVNQGRWGYVGSMVGYGVDTQNVVANACANAASSLGIVSKNDYMF